MPVLFQREVKVEGLEEKGGGEQKLGRGEGGEPVVRMYYMREKFLKKIINQIKKKPFK